jgi:hypothetical protein
MVLPSILVSRKLAGKKLSKSQTNKELLVQLIPISNSESESRELGSRL